MIMPYILALYGRKGGGLCVFLVFCNLSDAEKTYQHNLPIPKATPDAAIDIHSHATINQVEG